MGFLEAAAAGAFTQAGTGTFALGEFLAAGAAAAAVPTLIASTTVGAAGAINQAATQKDIAKFQTEISDRNIKSIEQANRFNEIRERSISRRRQGRVEARLGASGFGNSGSALNLISDIAIQNRLQEAISLSRGSNQLSQELVNRSQDSFRREVARGDLEQRGLDIVAQGILDTSRFSLAKRGLIK